MKITLPWPRDFQDLEVPERAMMAFWRHGTLGTGKQEPVDSASVFLLH